MNHKVLISIALLAAILSSEVVAGVASNFQTLNDLIPGRDIFIQNGNINTVFSTDGIFNQDRSTFTNSESGFIWPVQASSRMTVVYTSGIWIGAKTVLPSNQKELRLAASFYNSHYSPGNIPLIGQIPPVSVCNDTAFNGYLVNLEDQSLVNGGTRTKVAGGRTYTFVYSPWSAWPINQGAPYVEVNNIPGYQPGWNSDRPGIGIGFTRPSEILFVAFMDYKNCTGAIHQSEISLPGGTLPLGVEIQQLAYMFNVAGFQDVIFTSFKIINKSARSWDSTYVTLVNDGDLGEAYDDAIGCDTLKNYAYTYNADNLDLVYGQAPPAVGYRLLQGPVIYTGNVNDTAKLPCSSLIRYRMIKMTGHNKFLNGGSNCFTDPDNAVSAYNFMRGLDGCGDPIINPNTGQPTTYNHGNGWQDLSPGDKRNIMNSGPFTMNSGDTQQVVYAYAVGRSSSNIMSLIVLMERMVRVDQWFYDCFSLIGVTPLSIEIPASFSLSQNYPNPFNPVTNIRFDIPSKGFVRVALYDAIGREIYVLVNTEMPAGSYKVDWNASDFPSGVYFCRLSAGDFTETKKMVLVK